MSILVKITDLDLSGKTVLIREDYNVPIKNGVITNDKRIRATLPTLQQVLEAGAKIILVSHLGRPIAGEYDEIFSLAPVAKLLSDFLNINVPIIKDWTNGIDMTHHQVVLCENVRFEKGETKNDDKLARKMARLCQVYINDAFATAHRAQASTHGVAKYAAVSAAGPLLINELKALTKALKEPEKPVVAIVGGAKISGKLTILESLSEKVDQLIIGGGIVNTFLKAAGYEVGKSLYEEDLVKAANKLIRQTAERGGQIPLPIDVVCGKSLNETAEAVTKSVSAVEIDDIIMDLGSETMMQLGRIIAEARTIVWNGPLGVFEFKQFSEGTESLAKAIASSGAYSIAGGGETIAAISKFNVENKISYISTGGGAFLEFLKNKGRLPAIDILEEAARAWKSMERAREL